MSYVLIEGLIDISKVSLESRDTPFFLSYSFNGEPPNYYLNISIDSKYMFKLYEYINKTIVTVKNKIKDKWHLTLTLKEPLVVVIKVCITLEKQRWKIALMHQEKALVSMAIMTFITILVALEGLNKIKMERDQTPRTSNIKSNCLINVGFKITQDLITQKPLLSQVYQI
jgi:hypothetical protein